LWSTPPPPLPPLPHQHQAARLPVLLQGQTLPRLPLLHRLAVLIPTTTASESVSAIPVHTSATVPVWSVLPVSLMPAETLTELAPASPASPTLPGFARDAPRAPSGARLPIAASSSAGKTPPTLSRPTPASATRASVFSPELARSAPRDTSSQTDTA
jgi:hypothetical protein